MKFAVIAQKFDQNCQLQDFSIIGVYECRDHAQGVIEALSNLAFDWGDCGEVDQWVIRGV